MRVIAIDRYGTPDVMREMDLPKPVCPRDGVLIRNRACGLNPLDYRVRRGELKWLKGWQFPHIIGSDFCGEIEEVGDRVRDFEKGQRVYGFVNALQTGSYGEYVLAQPDQIAVAPANLSDEEAASLPIAALTSVQCFHDQVNLKPGQRVLINGCTGGVGSFAVQIAKALGARVTATCSAKNLTLARQLGCDEAFDYRQFSLTDLAGKLDVCFDAAAVSNFSSIKKYLQPKGWYITTLPGPAIFFHQTITKFGSGKKAAFTLVRSRRESLILLRELVEQGRVEPIIEQTYSMKNIVEAHQKLQQGHTRGKLVLKID